MEDKYKGPLAEVSDEEEDLSRKTLADQVREGKELKELEYRKQLEAQNSSYKLDEKSLQYYDELRERERAEELVRRQREVSELTKYRLKKAQTEALKSHNKPQKSQKLRISKQIQRGAIKSNKSDSPIPKSIEVKDKQNDLLTNDYEKDETVHETIPTNRPTEAKQSQTPQSIPTPLVSGYSSDSE